MKHHCLAQMIALMIACSAASSAGADAGAARAPTGGDPAIIPHPVRLERGAGEFRIGPTTRLIAAGPAEAEARKLIDTLAPAMGFQLRLDDTAPDQAGTVALTIDGSLKEPLGEEGYELRVTRDRIDLRAAAPAGLFYGGQTLRQLLPPDVFSNERVEGVQWIVPCVEIVDHPRFGWRGLLIDPARHFIPVEDVKRFIDIMAAHKFNRLQMHLTDNIGWRVEIKKYPDLTRLASSRDRSGGKGGFYTQDEVRELVRYAAERHVTIVPEIEMPYHAGAAINAYPNIGINPARVAGLSIDKRWGKLGGLVAPRPETVSFMQDVLSEVIVLFPSRFIHIGGDEANLRLWAGDPELQAQMKRVGCKDAQELHSWFIKQMDAYLTKHDRRLLGWDEILQGGLAPGATVMSWRGIEGGIAAAKAGHDVVMAPTSHTYFDYRQAPNERGLGRSVINLQKAYSFEAIPPDLTAEETRHVLGGQAQLWGELIPDQQRREFMAYPRACALIETLWSPKDNRSFRQFLRRLLDHRKRLKAAGVNYRPLDEPLVKSVTVSAQNFDYFSNNWNVVGLKDYNFGARITPKNELVLAGKTPVQIRIGADRTALSRENPKLAMDGWMPIILVTAEDGPVRYEVAYWATPLPDVKDWKKAFDWPTEGENFLNWIRVKATNTSDKPVEASVQLGPNAGARAAKTPQEQRGAKVDKAHSRQHAWSWQLPPGGTAEGVARYPFFAIDDPKKYDKQDPQRWLRRTREYWQGVMDRAAHIEVPCRKANEALLAAHVCQLIANDHGEVHGGEDFYDTFYIRDGAYQVMELEEAGFMDTAAKAVELYLVRQGEDGRFESQKNQFDANGQAVWVLWQYYRMTRDREFLNRVYPQMLRAVRWAMKARRTTAPPFAGVLPTAPADGECLWGGKNHIVGYDLWNLRGMLCTADAAKVIGKTADAEELTAEAAAYRQDIDAVWKKTGIPHFPPSWEKVGTHWGNTETLWPTELFARHDPRVAALSRHVREDFAGGFIEGTIQWKGTGDREAIHPYMGAYTTMVDLIRGDHEKVVEDFYWYLLHSTAAHAFPEGIYYKKRMAWSHTIPHVTGACNYAIMLRHMLVHEAGDQLHLLGAVPDWWLGDGKEIHVKRLPTHFGQMNLTVRGTKAGVEVELDPPKRNPPKRIVLTLPKSRPLVGRLDGVELLIRSDQKKRWDFPTVVEQYLQTSDFVEQPTLSKPNAVSLTTGKPATCSHALPPHPARLANDGRSNDTGSYWATDVKVHPGEAWWQVDLGEPTSVGRVVVVGYYGDQRHYGFVVATSLDGQTWQMAADRRDNKTLATSDGYTCRFNARPTRYIRVTQTHNSANTGRHLVEVMAFEK
jgi:hexosaminidase